MDKSKQILIVSGVYPPEPFVSARMSEAIAQELSMTDKVTVLCPPVSRPIGKVLKRINDPSSSFNTITLTSYTCPESKVFGRLRESYSFGKSVAKYIRANKRSIRSIYANTHPTLGQYLLLKEARRYGIPVVIHIQDIYPESLTRKLGIIGRLVQPLLAKYDEKMMKKASGIITISSGMKQLLDKSRSFDKGFVKVVYNWQDESIFDNNYSKEDSDTFTFMFVGSISPTASLDLVVEAFGLADLENAKLVLAGDGSDKQRCIEVASKFPKANIIFRSVSPNEVPSLQAEADVLLLPLKKGISQTALPSKLPAYMFSAKPILACVEDNSDVATILKDAGCGWITEPENLMMLSLQMQNCMTFSPEKIKQMGISARKYSLSHFTKRINLHAICKIIKSV